MVNQKLTSVLEEQGLTPREIEVSYLVTTGHSNKEISQELDIKEVTVKFHLKNVFKKMSLASRTQLAIFCIPHVNNPETSLYLAASDENWINKEEDRI